MSNPPKNARNFVDQYFKYESLPAELFDEYHHNLDAATYVFNVQCIANNTKGKLYPPKNILCPWIFRSPGNDDVSYDSIPKELFLFSTRDFPPPPTTASWNTRAMKENEVSQRVEVKLGDWVCSLLDDRVYQVIKFGWDSSNNDQLYLHIQCVVDKDERRWAPPYTFTKIMLQRGEFILQSMSAANCECSLHVCAALIGIPKDVAFGTSHGSIDQSLYFSWVEGRKIDLSNDRQDILNWKSEEGEKPRKFILYSISRESDDEAILIGEYCDAIEGEIKGLDASCAGVHSLLATGNYLNSSASHGYNSFSQFIHYARDLLDYDPIQVVQVDFGKNVKKHQLHYGQSKILQYEDALALLHDDGYFLENYEIPLDRHKEKNDRTIRVFKKASIRHTQASMRAWCERTFVFTANDGNHWFLCSPKSLEFSKVNLSTSLSSPD